MHEHSNVDAAEIARFQSAASRWWDPEGDMRPLHELNPVRLAYVERSGTLRGRTVLDVGCGGGLLAEAKGVISLLERNGLKRGENGLRVIMMCEIPSNALLADRYLEHFDGFSIGSNDMTQLTLGVDRDSGGPIATTFDERDDAVKAMLAMSIEACQRHGRYVGICGQGPSDHPDLAEWLVDRRIESMSLNPDTVVETWIKLARHAAERKRAPGL